MVLRKLQNFFLYLFALSVVVENWRMMSFEGNSLPKYISYAFVITCLLDLKKLAVGFSRISKYLIVLIFLISIIFISFIIHYSNDFIGFWVIQSISLNFFFFLLASAIIAMRPKVGVNMFNALFTGILILSVLYALGIGTEFTEGRISIFGDNPNKIGMFAVIAILYILSILFENINTKSKNRLLLIIFLPLLLNLAGQTGSRITFIGLVLSVTFFFVLQNKRKKITRAIITVVGIGLTIGLYYYLMEFDTLRDRVLRTVQERDIAGRDIIWQTILPEASKYPIFGMGVNTYAKFSLAKFGKFASPHNVFIEVFVYGGIAALLLYIYYNFMLLKAGYKVYRDEYFIFPMTLIFFLILIYFSGQALNVKAFFLIYAYAACQPFYFQSKSILKENLRLKRRQTNKENHDVFSVNS